MKKGFLDEIILLAEKYVGVTILDDVLNLAGNPF